MSVPDPLSVAIITLNEERCIRDCLLSVSWADDIVVIDGGSKDRTKEICLDPMAPWAGKLRLIERAWTGFKDQRNYCLNQVKNDWVFVIDSDEVCSPELRERLLHFMKEPAASRYKYWKIRRTEFFMGREIKHGIWSPSFQDRFFNRRGISYINDIHEYPVFPEPAQKIQEPLIHNPDLSIEKFLDKMNKYTTIEAKERFQQGQRTNLVHMFAAFFVMFYKTFFYYKGYRDGAIGFVIGCLEGVSRVTRHVKLWREMQKAGTK